MKNFEEWVNRKINIEKRNSAFHFDEREIWWCAIGENIGEEICGKNNNFERPVLIFKKHSKETSFVLPLTSTIREGKNFFNIELKDKDRCVLLHQGRFISKKRLLRRMETVSENKFNLIKSRFDNLYKIENPPCGGNSQAPYGEDIISISDTDNKSSGLIKEGKIYRHYKTKGLYLILKIAKLQVRDGLNILDIDKLDMKECAVYQSQEDGSVWVRPIDYFLEKVAVDGVEVSRFELIYKKN